MKKWKNVESLTIELTLDVGDDGNTAEKSFFVFHAKLHDTRIAHAEFEIHGDRAHFVDLRVQHDFWFPRNGFERFLTRWGLYPERLDMRGMGVGKRLVERVIEECRSRGVKQIWGAVVQKDLDLTPRLLEFYEKFGFVVSKPDEETAGVPAKKKVTLTLD